MLLLLLRVRLVSSRDARVLTKKSSVSLLAQVFALALWTSSAHTKFRFGSLKKQNIRGKCAWITGASQGLGEEIAYEMAKQGATLILSGRREERLREVAKECEKRGATRVETLVMDMYDDRTAMKKIVQKAYDLAKKMGKLHDDSVSRSIDMFINCAGGSQAASALSGDDEAVDRAIFQLNCLGPISLTKEVAKMMTTDPNPHVIKRIVAVCSVAAKVPSPGQACYSAAKSGYAAFLNTLRSEISDTGVRVVCVYPGPIASRMKAGQTRVIFRASLETSSPTCRVKTVGGASPMKSPAKQPTTEDQSAPTLTREERRKNTKGRLRIKYVSRRVISAAINGVDETVLAPRPIMLLTYFTRFFPTLSYAILDVIGPNRARKADSGEDIYSLARSTAKKSN